MKYEGVTILFHWHTQNRKNYTGECAEDFSSTGLTLIVHMMYLLSFKKFIKYVRMFGTFNLDKPSGFI